MKMKILSIVILGSIASTNFCGNGLLTQSKSNKIKIANASTLEARFKKVGADLDVLEHLGVIEFFADKEFSQDELDGKVNLIFEQAWEELCVQIKQQRGCQLNFEAEKDKQHNIFLAEVSELKSQILEVLKQEPKDE